MTNATIEYIVEWKFWDPRRGIKRRSRGFTSEQEARRHCSRMKRAGCEATMTKIK